MGLNERGATVGAVDWTISIVVHGKGRVVGRLLESLAATVTVERTEVVLTLNRGLRDDTAELVWPGPFQRICNVSPAGFGANHNAALARASGRYFSTLDPDIRLVSNVFGDQAGFLDGHPRALCTVPYLDDDGVLQDNGRQVPTLGRLISRCLGTAEAASRPEAAQAIRHDWLAGLQIAARSDWLRELGGFDEAYFMYCEDVDLGLRNQLAGGQNYMLPTTSQIHNPSRASRRDLRHLYWHLRSLARLWSSPVYRQFLHRHRSV